MLYNRIHTFYVWGSRPFSVNERKSAILGSSEKSHQALVAGWAAEEEQLGSVVGSVVGSVGSVGCVVGSVVGIVGSEQLTNSPDIHCSALVRNAAF